MNHSPGLQLLLCKITVVGLVIKSLKLSYFTEKEDNDGGGLVCLKV